MGGARDRAEGAFVRAPPPKWGLALAASLLSAWLHGLSFHSTGANGTHAANLLSLACLRYDIGHGRTFQESQLTLAVSLAGWCCCVGHRQGPGPWLRHAHHGTSRARAYFALVQRPAAREQPAADGPTRHRPCRRRLAAVRLTAQSTGGWAPPLRALSSQRRDISILAQGLETPVSGLGEPKRQMRQNSEHGELSHIRPYICLVNPSGISRSQVKAI
jgi:hypothetical protein